MKSVKFFLDGVILYPEHKADYYKAKIICYTQDKNVFIKNDEIEIIQNSNSVFIGHDQVNYAAMCEIEVKGKTFNGNDKETEYFRVVF